MFMNTKLAALTLAGTLALAACGGEAEEAEIADPMADTAVIAPMEPAPAAAGDPMALLSGTVEAARGGLTNMAASAAVSNIQQWQQTLTAANNPALQPIVTDLQALEQALQAQPIDGAQVGQILSRLGEQTTAAASAAEAGTADQVRELGGLLSQAGSQLSGGM